MLSDIAASAGEGDAVPRSFNLDTDPSFVHYKRILARHAATHRPYQRNDFCIVGQRFEDGSAHAWVFWQQGKKLILWESRTADLDMSRRQLDLRTDVVATDADVGTSTYLVTRAWVNELKEACRRHGTRFRIALPPDAIPDPPPFDAK